MIPQIINKLKSIIIRGIINVVDDSAGRQACQVTMLAGEHKDRVERVMFFGVTSNPPKGSSAILAAVGADRSRVVIIGDNDKDTRKKGLAEGETALYDAFSQSIHLMADGTILIKTNDKVRIEGNLEVTGEIIDRCDIDGQSMNAMRTIFNTHTHTENDGGNTSVTNLTMGGGA